MERGDIKAEMRFWMEFDRGLNRNTGYRDGSPQVKYRVRGVLYWEPPVYKVPITLFSCILKQIKISLASLSQQNLVLQKFPEDI